MAGGHIQAVGVTLLSRSRLLLRPKLARSRGQGHEVNLASGNEMKGQIARFVVLIAR